MNCTLKNYYDKFYISVFYHNKKMGKNSCNSHPQSLFTLEKCQHEVRVVQ